MAWLFRIAAGLESLVLGEDQILGQVRDALDFSRTMGYSKKELNRIVRDGITCAKQIKTELKISEKPLSVSYIGIKKLEEACGISGKRILVIGLHDIVFLGNGVFGRWNLLDMNKNMDRVDWDISGFALKIVVEMPKI